MNESVNESMGAIIARKRKELGLTQEQLAGELGISYQAVSKWENELSSPDISTLPLLADVLGLSLDEIFGRAPAEHGAAQAEPEPVEEEAEPIEEKPQTEPEQALIPAPEAVYSAGVELPWPDDNTLHAVLFVGHRLIGYEKAGALRRVVLHYEGEALNVQSDFDVNVEGDVRGSVSAEGDVSCEDVGGSVTAVGDISCSDVTGDVRAGGDVSCDEVSGHVQAGGDVTCDNVEGSVSAGSDVNCDNVDGNISAGGDVKCADVEGSITAGGDVSCGNVGGDVRAEGDLSCAGIVDNSEFHSNLKDKKRGFSFGLKL